MKNGRFDVFNGSVTLKFRCLVIPDFMLLESGVIPGLADVLKTAASSSVVRIKTDLKIKEPLYITSCLKIPSSSEGRNPVKTIAYWMPGHGFGFLRRPRQPVPDVVYLTHPWVRTDYVLVVEARYDDIVRTVQHF